MTHHIDLATIHLQTGGHATPGPDTVCLLEAVAWFAGEPHTDQPKCVSPVLGAFGRSWNDALDDATWQRLVPYIPRLVGTAGDPEADQRRAWLATDWLVRTFTVAWLRKAGLTARADDLAALAEISSTEIAKASQATIEAARKEADVAGEAAAATAGATAWAAAWATARAAASSAWDAAWAAASAAASSARAAAWATAAQYDAAYTATRPLLDEAFAETQAELTESAFALLDRMIDVGAAVPA